MDVSGSVVDKTSPLSVWRRGNAEAEPRTSVTLRHIKI